MILKYIINTENLLIIKTEVQFDVWQNDSNTRKLKIWTHIKQTWWLFVENGHFIFKQLTKVVSHSYD